MKYLLLYLFAFSESILSAQTNLVSVSFFPLYENAPLLLNKGYGTDSVWIETLKFYISQIELYNGKDRVFAEQNSFHLIDLTNTGTLVLDLDVPESELFTHIKFNIGIDSLTNVSGAFGGDLDPVNGMYWTWQSGYINFKLEGVSEICSARNHQFQFHLGGYQEPFNTLENVQLKITDIKDIKIDIAIDKLLEKINLKETFQVMSPNQNGVEIARLLPSIFSVAK